MTAGHIRRCDHDGMSGTGGRVLLAAPRGYCAGVERAVEAVERALAKHGAPVYVRKQIVHNLHVVRDLEPRARSSSRTSTRCPRVRSPCCRRTARRRRVFDEAQLTRARPDRRHLSAGDQGPRRGAAFRRHRPDDRPDRPRRPRGGRGHERPGAGADRAGPGPRQDARTVELPAAGRSPTSPRPPCRSTRPARSSAPSRSDTPTSKGPPGRTSATPPRTGRTPSRSSSPRVDVLLVIGSKNSSNSNRLAEVARERGKPGYLVDDETEVDPAWLEGASVVGLTSGASAPEHLVERMLEWLAARGFDDVELVSVAEEGVRFSLPAGVRPVADGLTSRSVPRRPPVARRRARSTRPRPRRDRSRSVGRRRAA